MAIIKTLKTIEWNRNFTLFATASFASGAGNALIPIAFSIESFNISPSGVGIALVMLALWLGRFLGMLIYRKLTITALKPTMILADITRLLAQFGLLLYIALSTNTVIAMVISAFVYGLASSFYLPASFQLLPSITSAKSREQANSVLAILGDIYSIIGPLSGATLVLLLGFETVLMIDCITFLIAIGLIYAIRLVPKSETSSEPAAQERKSDTSTPPVPLPNWSINGLKSWFFVSICLGFLGVAGPAMVIANHSESDWAFVATCIAIGSLVGSTGMLSGRFKHFTWNRVHLLCLLLLSLQAIAISSTLPITVIVVCAMFGACATTMSGIKWDTVTQTHLTASQLPRFASNDQMVTNTAVPLGMVLFGITSHFGVSHYGMMAVVATVVLSFWYIRSDAPNTAQELAHD
ncbi:MAG: MFS transporter [Vibrio sp.]|uniref:MFS transporter n=1 Tax=Vibrio sp. TaxID=678 RepID=UPI001EB374BC|nr:MFS transporter [Vibrio sp.]NRB67649.1 MFS transporter [Vibrio sp.]